ncbi:MAG: GNAT family N-acetyltransferase [Acidobacteria bacterium]|nr:GNAT family N-acetyltransferase [Acidobacteriota bacterium]
MSPVLTDLERTSPGALDALLDEEVRAWGQDLGWDFQDSARLLREHAVAGALEGKVLWCGRDAAGYTYWVVDGAKGLVGGLFVRRSVASRALEYLLLDAALAALRGRGGLRRIESQLLMMQSEPEAGFPGAAYLRTHSREYLETHQLRLPAPPSTPGFEFLPWARGRIAATATLIAESYVGHCDSGINDQYESSAGAHQFLSTLLNYPGCGTFLPSASWAALDPATRRLAGVVVSTMIAPGVAHVAQICVAPAYRGRRLGYELMRLALDGSAGAGCRCVTLTVTQANEAARNLYVSLGFSVRRRFHALVWSGW